MKEYPPRKTNELNTQAFCEMIGRCGVDHIIVDFDDTLIDTSGTFNQGLDNAAAVLLFGQKPNNIHEAQKARHIRDTIIIPTIRGLAPRFVVHPIISETALRHTARQLDISEDSNLFAKALLEVEAIYTTLKPKIFADTAQFIDACQITNCFLVLATIAEREWTSKKLSWSGLSGKFNEVICLDVTTAKHLQLKNMLLNLDAKPENTLFIGDSLASDMHLVTNGKAHGVWINRRPANYNNLSVCDRNKIAHAVNEHRLVMANNLISAVNLASGWLK